MSGKILRAYDNSPEQQEKEQEEKDFRLLLLVVKQIIEANLKRGESRVVECPICGRKRQISKATYNGHIWSVCEKNDCPKFMQ